MSFLMSIGHMVTSDQLKVASFGETMSTCKIIPLKGPKCVPSCKRSEKRVQNMHLLEKGPQHGNMIA